ncbi:YbaB/EbfC family nucleoid-associated protein [Nocardia sp. NPDC004085]
MTNEQAKAELADILDGVQEQMRIIARLQQERAELTGRATVRGKRVTVVVNADNTVIDTQFGPNIEDLSHAEIAKAVTEAAQQASADVARKTRELVAPLDTHRARMPKLSDLVEGMPDLRAPEPVPAPTTPPNARERREFSDGSGMRFTETVERDRGGSVTDSSW